MGWTDTHLHSFVANGKEYGPIDPEDNFGADVEDEEQVAVGQLLKKKGAKLKYNYDFGDGWRHTILYEEPAPEPVSIPIALAGKRACPPEDCGGPYRFADFLAIKSGKTSPDEDSREWLEWMGDFDPEEFSLNETNEVLRGLKLTP